MSRGKYLLIGVFVGLLVAVGGTFAGESIASWVQSVQSQAIAAGMGAIADLIANPLVWLMQNPLIGGALMVIAWPFLGVWLLLLFIMILFGFGADAARATRDKL